MSSYRADRQWADQFLPEIKQIIGPLLLEPAPFELDANEATDLIVMRARDVRIAARMRTQGYADRYPFDFTIRARRDSGAQTELAKIVNGWGDWLFYGHAGQDDQIVRWMVVNLAAFRAALIRNGTGGVALRYGDKPNGDGTYFKWFDARSFPAEPPLLIASSHALTQSEAA